MGDGKNCLTWQLSAAQVEKLNLQNQAVGLNTPVDAYVGKYTFSDGATSFLNPSPVQWWDKQV